VIRKLGFGDWEIWGSSKGNLGIRNFSNIQISQSPNPNTPIAQYPKPDTPIIQYPILTAIGIGLVIGYFARVRER
jgi:hypothetical protein